MRCLSLFSTLVFVLLAGCDAREIVTPETPQRVTGTWEGSSLIGRIEMVLAEDIAGSVTGGGFVRKGTRSAAFDVTGANAFPDVALSLHFRSEALTDSIIGSQLLNYSAEFDAFENEITLFGQLNGGFLQDNALRLERD